MKATELRVMLREWDVEDRVNLASLLGLSKDQSSPEQIAHEIKWRFHSRARANVQSVVKGVAAKARQPSSRFEKVSVDESREPPSYEELVVAACRKLSVLENESSIPQCELFLSHAVIVSALQKMKPSERVLFFSSTIDVEDLAEKAGIRKSELRGPATTMALLGVAQASGFGVYLASTSALGFVTSAIGVTLPFAAYTGLTSTIAFVIGPPGWLSAVIWGAWRITQPEWRTLVPAILYMISTRSRLAAASSR